MIKHIIRHGKAPLPLSQNMGEVSNAPCPMSGMVQQGSHTGGMVLYFIICNIQALRDSTRIPTGGYCFCISPFASNIKPSAILAPALCSLLWQSEHNASKLSQFNVISGLFTFDRVMYSIWCTICASRPQRSQIPLLLSMNKAAVLRHL